MRWRWSWCLPSEKTGTRFKEFNAGFVIISSFQLKAKKNDLHHALNKLHSTNVSTASSRIDGGHVPSAEASLTRIQSNLLKAHHQLQSTQWMFWINQMWRDRDVDGIIPKRMRIFSFCLRIPNIHLHWVISNTSFCILEEFVGWHFARQNRVPFSFRSTRDQAS